MDMLLRTLDENHTRATTGKSLKILFEEVGLVDALWYVCDNDVDESDVAEKAAELIDDFYMRPLSQFFNPCRYRYQ